MIAVYIFAVVLSSTSLFVGYRVFDERAVSVRLVHRPMDAPSFSGRNGTAYDLERKTWRGWRTLYSSNDLDKMNSLFADLLRGDQIVARRSESIGTVISEVKIGMGKHKKLVEESAG